ncbi:MAG TPA: hypothetical protein VFE53_06360, partial [Mucilaginibacter sp.]|nr:hypothetical protein [Mucilaginibacter sp.]
VKKNKTRSKKIWDKNKYDKIAYFIINDVSIRLLKDVQWQNKQYIPHPSTYLNNKLWEDDITEFSNIKKPTGKNSSWSNYQQGVEKQSGGNVYEHCSTPQ